MVQALWMTGKRKNFLVIATDIKRHTLPRAAKLEYFAKITRETNLVLNLPVMTKARRHGEEYPGFYVVENKTII